MRMSSRPGLRVAAAVAAVLAVAMSAGGCGKTVKGSAHPAGGSGTTTINTNFDKLLRECEVVGLDQIGAAVGNATVVSPSFNGAVCMWDVEDAPGGSAMVTLNWYEEGSLNNEKSNN